MNSKLKHLIAITALGAITLGLYSSASIAAPMAKLQKPATKVVHVRKVVRLIVIKGHHRAWRLGLARNKHLNQQEAQTLVKAALLMHNRHNVQINNVTEKTSKRGTKLYLMNLVSKDGKNLSRVVVNSASGKIRPLRS